MAATAMEFLKGVACAALSAHAQGRKTASPASPAAPVAAGLAVAVHLWLQSSAPQLAGRSLALRALCGERGAACDVDLASASGEGVTLLFFGAGAVAEVEGLLLRFRLVEPGVIERTVAKNMVVCPSVAAARDLNLVGSASVLCRLSVAVRQAVITAEDFPKGRRQGNALVVAGCAVFDDAGSVKDQEDADIYCV